jgi:hypothetical protein
VVGATYPVIGSHTVPFHQAAGPQFGGFTGAFGVSAGTIGAMQEVCDELGTNPPVHSSAEAGVAVISAGAATNVVNPRSRDVKRAVRRIIHLLIYARVMGRVRSLTINITRRRKFVINREQIDRIPQSIRRK